MYYYVGCNDRIIDQYITAIKEHKDQLFDGQKLIAYKVYLIEAGVVSSKEFRDIEKQYSRNRPRMEAIVELVDKQKRLTPFHWPQCCVVSLC